MITLKPTSRGLKNESISAQFYSLAAKSRGRNDYKISIILYIELHLVSNNYNIIITKTSQL